MVNGGDYVLNYDDNMLKLAKMQETLLKVSVDNRQENLDKYKDIVVKIDKQAFLGLLNELEQINDHNQTLEDELQFLEIVSNYYDQLYELQLGFKKVCELYGDTELQLSDLSQIDIEYINHRKNLIEGYLINLKNIEINKDKLEKLNDALIKEEKNKIVLSKRLLDYEETLRKNFINAEGRIVLDGKLQYISVISEYKELDYDFKLLLVNKEMLKELLFNVSSEKLEIDEKYKTAEICYNSNPSSSSKQILDDISNEFFKLRYRLTMLKILELLSYDYDDCEKFKDKREKILDLIKYRLVCLNKLGRHISIDPFARTKVEEQLNVTTSFLDNSKKIRKIIEETNELSKSVDLMVSQNRDYRIELDETRDLIIDNVSMGDIVSLVEVPESIYFAEQRVSDNQVISIKDLNDFINMDIVRQKTSGVIKRVNQMMTSNVSVVEDEKVEIVNPELVIIDQSSDFLENSVIDDSQFVSMRDESKDFELPFIDESFFLEERKEEGLKELDLEQFNVDEEITDVSDDSYVVSNNYNSSIFENVDPFESMPLFVDRTDEDVSFLEDDKFEQQVVDDMVKQEEITEVSNSELKDELIENDMVDTFWVTQSSDDKLDNTLSFDEQINNLLLNEENNKIKKLSA